MMNFIQWTNLAFNELEVLPENISFEIIRQVDLLAEFPELGALLESRFAKLRGLRHLIIKRNWRVVYEFDESEKTVNILAVQKLPTATFADARFETPKTPN
ncbi:MAG: type II toxin-antitoxin system RelE/ParE family toxin [Blastocatellia bacterium]|nr:type II toxin-antitoxin system RelE/ParE family toxin [Blastocatellia bacterium]